MAYVSEELREIYRQDREHDLREGLLEHGPALYEMVCDTPTCPDEDTIYTSVDGVCPACGHRGVAA